MALGSAFDAWLLRGSGVYSTDEEVVLSDPCACGSTAAVRYVDDFGSVSVTCAECDAEIPTDEPDAADFEPDFEPDTYYGID